MALRMNTITGKEILALARGGDYAHPGEEEAIDLAMAPVAKRPGQVLLDIGCGRGGTAHYVSSRGWGRVVGVDIDAENIASARGTYPGQTFICSDVAQLPAAWPHRADVIYLLTAFYAFPDQAGALDAMRAVAADQARLVIFDYTWPVFDARSEALVAKRSGSWQPLRLDVMPAMLERAGWRPDSSVDMTADFARWYDDLANRIVAAEAAIVAHAGREWYDYAAGWYRQLANAIHEGVVGGVAIYAHAG
ncbi:MAG: class I SAM-dependent methyltransferase [Acidobacteria bacterium]|nr:class I SAM-dependent methyltransferase [Acidobacteriota bacterium]